MDQVEDTILILIKSDEIIPILHLTSNQDRGIMQLGCLFGYINLAVTRRACLPFIECFRVYASKTLNKINPTLLQGYLRPFAIGHIARQWLPGDVSNIVYSSRQRRRRDMPNYHGNAYLTLSKRLLPLALRRPSSLSW